MKSIIRNKGQMSLEMIIGLVILLVVAAVVINIFITKVNLDQIGGPPEKQLEKREFISNCESYCKEYRNKGSLKYCKEHYKGADWNMNEKEGELIEVGPDASWQVCEDRVYCFHAVPCDWDTGELTMSDCKALLCQVYSEKYRGNLTMATKALKDDIRMSENPVCKQELNQIPIMDNWYKSRFANDNFCGAGGGTPSVTTTTTGGSTMPVQLSCSVSGQSVNCQWSNCEAGTGGNKAIIILGPSGDHVTTTQSSGSTTFPDLDPAVYSVTIECNNGGKSEENLIVS
ncbi:MAG: hypothetical protein ABEK36_02385 [Candidatus Aenigmatarchaeota archaeon]